MLDYSEDSGREVIDVSPDMTVETNHAHEPARGLRARGKKCRARSGACIEANE